MKKKIVSKEEYEKTLRAWKGSSSNDETESEQRSKAVHNLLKESSGQK